MSHFWHLSLHTTQKGPNNFKMRETNILHIFFVLSQYRLDKFETIFRILMSVSVSTYIPKTNIIPFSHFL